MPIDCAAAAVGAKSSVRPRCRIRTTYRPRPGSRRFVQHLGEWYAQAHPTEDFAETFAVWLKPRSAWRREYRGWPAFAKLEFIDALVDEIGATPPLVTERGRIEDIAEDTRSLREHYERKFSRYRLPRRTGADELLMKVFTATPARRTAPKAASLVRELRNPLRREIVRSGAFSEYLVHQVLRLVVARCESLDLYVRGPRRQLRAHLTWLIARLAESYEERQLPHVALVKKLRALVPGALDAGAAEFARRGDREGNRGVAHRVRRHLAPEAPRATTCARSASATACRSCARRFSTGSPTSPSTCSRSSTASSPTTSTSVAFLELMHQPYTGCNPRGMLLSRDKVLSKQLLTYHRIPTPQFMVFARGKRAARAAASCAFRCSSKSSTEDASLGIAHASVVERRSGSSSSASPSSTSRRIRMRWSRNTSRAASCTSACSATTG